MKEINTKKILVLLLIVIGVVAAIGVALKMTVLRSTKPTLTNSTAADSLDKNSLPGQNMADSLAKITALPEAQKPEKTDAQKAKSAVADSVKAKAKTAGHGWTVSESDSLYREYQHQSGTKAMEPGPGYFIRITKSSRQLTLFKDGSAVKIYPVGVGKNSVDKTRREDNATPEGNFRIQSINDSRSWKFNGANAYGPWFLRLDTSSGAFSGKSWTGIGIHGTSNENSIGGFVSHGCIRMFNKDITELKETVEEQFKAGGVQVVILP